MNKQVIIAHATLQDIQSILSVFEQAKKYMKEQGNPKQWSGNYPGRILIEQDILNEKGFIIKDQSNNQIIGYYYLDTEPDPTYKYIEGSGWLNDEPYATIHRIAIGKPSQGIGQFVLNQVTQAYANVRIDTHQNNLPMQHVLTKMGFIYCGVIYLANGEPRLAFQWTR